MLHMLSTFVVIAALAFACWVMVSETARGARWITLSRFTRDDPETVLSRIENAWQKSALTFEPVEILPESRAEEKIFTLSVGDRVFRTTLRRLPAPEPMSLMLTCVAANGQSYPLGREHRKIWQVVPRGDGSVVRVAATFRAPPGAILQAIFTFRRQLRMVAGA